MYLNTLVSCMEYIHIIRAYDIKGYNHIIHAYGFTTVYDTLVLLRARECLIQVVMALKVWVDYIFEWEI